MMSKVVTSVSLLMMVVVTGVLLGFNAMAASTPASALQSPQEIVNRLLQTNHIPAERVKSVKLDSQDIFNAYTDGQNIVMTKKLWNALKTNDERAFVLSHELGHIMANHIVKSTARNAGFSILTRMVGQATGNPWLVAGADIGLKLTNLKFSRKQEYEADERGIIEMKTAGYNPNAALVVFKVLQSGGSSRKGSEFLQTHPIPQSRIEDLVRKYGLKNDPNA
jgi:predicted Zn-dependent protease